MRKRSIFVTGLTAITVLTSAFAGTSAPAPDVPDVPGKIGARLRANTAETAQLSAQLLPGQVLVGASKISLEPTPDASAGEVWVRDKDECLPVSQNGVDPMAGVAHAADWRTPWIENNNCIYMGGYGIGPTNPVLTWDQQYGLWVRSTVLTDAQGDTLVLTLLDAEGYFGDYNRLCGTAEPRCGIFDIAEDLGTELGISADGVIIASTHSHTSLDLIGGWGAIPGWYMDQVAQSIKGSIRQAFANRAVATLEAGETFARGLNSERRNFYRSAEDPSVNWIRARDASSGAVISTVGTFATHPVSYDEELGIGHGDFPPVFAAQAEANQGGGMATIFQAGLGNMTGGGNWENKGKALANKLPAVGSGTAVSNPDIRVKREFWDQPVTNVPLGSLGAGGFFDRPFSGPAVVQAGKNANKPCRSASAVSARVNVVAAKIGDVVVTSAPGEIFANYTNTIEERSPVTALAIGQANDALGYMPQSFETDHVGRQGTGFSGNPRIAEYEDAYSIDACFGDVALETTIRLLGQI